jgi:hypothetical protein
MEIEQFKSTQRENSYVILCKKCLEKGEYYIPLYYLSESKKIEYTCSKNHLIEEGDICYKILTKKLFISLSECTDKQHKNNYQGQSSNFCAWCEKCGKNICQVDLAKDLKRNHDYLLFMHIMPDSQYIITVKEKLNKLKDLIEKYNTLCPDAKEEINYLKKTFERNYMNFDLYYNKKILNYQTINNIIFNSCDDFNNKSFELYENIFMQKRYKFFYKEILDKKHVNDINKIDIRVKLLINEEIIIFNNKNEIYFAIYNSGFNYIIIYDNKGNKINQISLFFLLYDPYLMVYNNILFTYDHYKIVIIYFSENFKTNEILNLYLDYKQIEINDLNNFDIGNFFLFDNLYKDQKLIKTSSNNFFFLTNRKPYSINLEKYLDKNIVNSIPGKVALKNLNNDYILKANNAFYKYNNDILEGIIYICGVKKKEDKYTYTIKILDEKLKNIFQIDFKCSYDYYYFNSTFFDFNYNYLNDMILIFIGSEIYQINSITKEIVTNYDISNNVSKIQRNSTLNLITFYNYNEKNKKLEQIIIIMDKISNNIYQLKWDEKLILFKKKFILPKIKNIIPLFHRNNFIDLDNHEDEETKLEKKYDEKILVVESENLLLFG